jgi:oxaloacetate decarboxylase gamma subunit
MKETLMEQGLTLMLAGMGTVFVFLTTLVAAMTVMSLVVRRAQATSSGPSDEEVAAISAAIEAHRGR